MNNYSIPNDHVMLNREVGLIQFYGRVLANALDHKAPLLERLNYLCIVCKNCDELFEVRVARLLKLYRNNPDKILPDGLNVKESLNLVRSHMIKLYDEIYDVYNNVILKALEKENIHIKNSSTWNDKEKKFAEYYFVTNLQPILTPIGIDPLHPFPLVQNKSLHFAVALDGKDEFGRNSQIAIVEAPRILNRVIHVPEEIANNKHTFILLQDIISMHVDKFFHGLKVLGCYPFRVTRSADFSINQDTKNIRQVVQKELNKRKYSECSRLELDISSGIPHKNIITTLLKHFAISEQDLYLAMGPVNLSRLSEIIPFLDLAELKYPTLVQGIPDELIKEPNIFKAMQRSDILIHTPYQSFDPIFALTQSAALDENVLAIKITVYRIGFESLLLKNLINAALAGKQIIVSVELFARFDEENNVELANQLENAGAHVVYGVMGYKVHAKMLTVVRREEDNTLKQYVHLGTGNYNETTAKIYTDFGLLTTNPEIASDVDKMFAQITGIGRAGSLKWLYQAPFTLHTMLYAKIENEINFAKVNKKAKIIAKMNSLIEPQIINLLYKASNAGVKIDLIIRGACLLKPGLRNLSENIRVISVVGRFLEHSRVFYFYNNGSEDLYLSSADWMQRNFFKRVETCTPILDKKIKKRIIEEGFLVHLKDNNDSWIMNSDGTYHKNIKRGRKFSSQKFLLEKLCTIN